MLEKIQLTSERLTTRELRESDTTILYKIYSDEEAMRFRGSKPLKNVAEAAKMVSDQISSEDDMLKVRKGIIDRKTGNLIGTLLLIYSRNPVEQCEIGFSFDHKEWNKGYGGELINLLLQDLKKWIPVKEFKAWCVKENIASVKLLTKNGFFRRTQNTHPYSYLFIKKVPSENRF